MAITATLSNHFKFNVFDNKIDFGADAIQVALARSGFVFDKDIHAKYDHFSGTTGTIGTISFTATDKINDSANGLGIFVVGQKVTVTTTSGLNDGTYTVTVVAAGQLTVSETTIATEAAGAAGNSDVTGADEIQTAFGYTLTGITAAGGALAEDDTNDRAEYTCNTITWTAAGGSIGPSPGAFIYDDTDADKTVIGYLDFGSEQTATTGNTFSIANIAVRLA